MDQFICGSLNFRDARSGHCGLSRTASELHDPLFIVYSLNTLNMYLRDDAVLFTHLEA